MRPIHGQNTNIAPVPSPTTLAKLASLAKIPDLAREDFSSDIVEAVRCAHKEQNVKKLRLFRREDYVPILKRTAQQASELHKLLSEAEADKIIPSAIASKFLRAAFIEQRQRIDDYLIVLDNLANAAQRAITIAAVEAGRPRGTRNHAGFDSFVFRLLLAAQTSGGKLTVYKSAHADIGWAGSLVEIIDLLRSSLPDQFLPGGNLGKHLDRLAQELRPRTPKRAGRKS